jgi:putative DNA primase/helicase
MDLIKKIAGGYTEFSPGGGTHWLYRCSEISGSTKLANQKKGDVLIETRGEGGYVIVAPSHGTVHPSGGKYRIKSGGVETIVTLTPDERKNLWDIARSLDEALSAKRSTDKDIMKEETGRPGDDFNQRENWPALMNRNGWVLVFSHGEKDSWRRPGKTVGISATTNYKDSDLLYVFSSSTGFEPGQSYSKFGAYTILEHGGDFGAAARALRNGGYGEKRTNKIPGVRPDLNLIGSEKILQALYRGQDGDAELFVQLEKDNFRFDHAAGSWNEWQGHYWREDETQNVFSAIHGIINLYGKELDRQSKILRTAAEEGEKEAEKSADKIVQELRKKIASLHRWAHKVDVLKLAASGKDSLGITGNEWDNDPWLLGCKNGVIDLRTGTMRNGKREDFLRTVSPTTFIGDVPCPTWDNFLFDVFDGDIDLIAYVQRLLGYAITGITHEDVFPILCGKGRNGKGTLLETIRYVLGPLAGPIKSETLLEQKGDRNSNAPDSDIIALRGLRIAWASETGEGRKLGEKKVKWLTGSDTLVGRQPYARREITFKPVHTLFLLTNRKPRVDPNDYALWQRIKIIPFNLSFVRDPQKENERKKDPELKEKLQIEASGILAWLIRGCMLWIQDGLQATRAMNLATEKYQEGENIIGIFMADCCFIGQNFQVQAGYLYKNYRDWCEKNGHKPVAGNKFKESLPEQISPDNSGQRVIYRGIGIKPPLT